MLHLIGPGGAGKTTAGAALASVWGVPFHDLDARFTAEHGDISAFIAAHGYRAYASTNVAVYVSLTALDAGAIVAMSSGFMVYDIDVHPHYACVHEQIIGDRRTVLVLPSFDLETCVRETVRRQMTRPFARPETRQELVIRQRFPLYMQLPVQRVETMGTPAETVSQIARMACLP